METKKSKRRLRLEQKYLDMGMSKEDAEIAAYKRARTEKMLAAIGGATLAAVGAYAAYKHYDYNTDRILKDGLELQNIANYDAASDGVRDAFYASFNPIDKIAYSGMFAKWKKGRNPIYKNVFRTKGKFKIASEKTGARVMSDLFKDTSFRKDVYDRLYEYQLFLSPEINDAVRRYRSFLLGNGKLTPKEAKKANKILFEGVNTIVPYGNGGDNDVKKLAEKIYDKLKSEGYSGLVDVYDKKFSAYNSIVPTIVFDKTKLDLEKSVELLDSEIARNNFLTRMRFTGEGVVKGYAPFAAVFGVAKTVSDAGKRRTEQRIFREYKKEHPNTKLSYDEIVEMEKNRLTTSD